jgi:hypothetical protein
MKSIKNEKRAIIHKIGSNKKKIKNISKEFEYDVDSCSEY